MAEERDAFLLLRNFLSLEFFSPIFFLITNSLSLFFSLQRPSGSSATLPAQPRTASSAPRLPNPPPSGATRANSARAAEKEVSETEEEEVKEDFVAVVGGSEATPTSRSASTGAASARSTATEGRGGDSRRPSLPSRSTSASLAARVGSQASAAGKPPHPPPSLPVVVVPGGSGTGSSCAPSAGGGATNASEAKTTASEEDEEEGSEKATRTESPEGDQQAPTTASAAVLFLLSSPAPAPPPPLPARGASHTLASHLSVSKTVKPPPSPEEEKSLPPHGDQERRRGGGGGGEVSSFSFSFSRPSAAPSASLLAAAAAETPATSPEATLLTRASGEKIEETAAAAGTTLCAAPVAASQTIIPAVPATAPARSLPSGDQARAETGGERPLFLKGRENGAERGTGKKRQRGGPEEEGEGDELSFSPSPPTSFQSSTPPETPTASSLPLQGLQAREETPSSLERPRREAEGGGVGTREGEAPAPAAPAAAPDAAAPTAAAEVLEEEEGSGATSKTSTPFREASVTASNGLCLCQAIGGGEEEEREEEDGDEEERA